MILKLARLLSSFFRFLSPTCLQSCAITSTGRGNKCLMYDAWATFVSWTFPFSPSTFVPLYFFFPLLTPGCDVLLFWSCVQWLVRCLLPPPPPISLPSSLSLLLRWWECLLLGDGARGEPNIFPLLAFPRSDSLRTTLDCMLFFLPLFFHHTQLFRFSFSVENSWGILGRFLLFLPVWINRFRFCVRALPSSTYVSWFARNAHLFKFHKSPL